MNLVSNFLVGPTASGKSEIAHQLAIKNNQCIVSADSMNVYRCMNIGTAKPPEKYLNEVIYYGIDVIDLTNSFSVMHWKKSVEKAWKEEKSIPITTGGTGLYIKCLIEGINPEENKNKQLRDYLESLSLKDCTPILSLLTGLSLSCWIFSKVRSSGFASKVISASVSIVKLL